MEIIDSIRELVELQGDKVKQGKQECKDWQLSHKNCFGCPYELGCSKSVRIGLTLFASSEFNGDKVQETIDKLLAAKSANEIKKILSPKYHIDK